MRGSRWRSWWPALVAAGTARARLSQWIARRVALIKRDDGEGPVSTAIMVALIAAVAVAVAAAIRFVAESWTAKIEIPAAP